MLNGHSRALKADDVFDFQGSEERLSPAQPTSGGEVMRV